jgi:sugar phosphate isomerase/epimerase
MTMLKLGTTTLALIGWLADPSQPGHSQRQRLDAIRRVVLDYDLPAIELALDLPMLYPTVFDRSFYEGVAELQQELGFVCTAHLPFLWIEPASLNEDVRQASAESLRRAVDLGQSVAIDTYVLHLWGLATTFITAQLQASPERQAIFGALMAQAERSLVEMCEILEPKDICIENLEDAHFELALALADQHQTSLCFDVGHLAWHGVDPLVFLRRHGDRIREVHLHDAARQPAGTTPAVRDHLALGEGEIDYQAIVQALEEMEFDGAVILELNSEADLRASLQRLGKAM